MSKSKEQIKAILSSGSDTDLASACGEPRRHHLQERRYIDTFGDDNTTCTYDWYDLQALDSKHVENYVCLFVGCVKICMNPFSDSIVSQKLNPYYFTQCEKCACIILTNRDIGKKLVCMNPQESCSHYNHTQPLPNDAFMSDVLELVNEHYKLN